MLIPYTNEDPYICAKECCDKHVVKLILEVAQGLDYAFRLKPPKGYYNHPYAKWIRQTPANTLWALSLFKGLINEYKLRYGRDHAYCHRYDLVVAYNTDEPITIMPYGTPEEYRRHFQETKSHFATWKPPAGKPDWWKTPCKGEISVQATKAN